MMRKIPWIPELKGSKDQLSLPLDTETILNFIKTGQNADGFYNSLVETFWAIVGLIKLGKFLEISQKDIIAYIMKHRVGTGGYSSRIKGEIADLESTFYAISLLYLGGLFNEELHEESLFCFCSQCGQKQLFKNQICFNCNAQITTEPTHCVICENQLQKSSSSNNKWNNLCDRCQNNFLQDLEFIQNFQKQGFREEGKKASYKSTFFALNTLSILNSIENIVNMKKILGFLEKNQYFQESERIYQVLCYFIIKKEKKIDYLPFLESIATFQHKNSGFGIDKKLPGILDTFWSIIPFYLTEKLDLLQLGSIYHFISGLKRDSDGGFAEQIMDTRSNIISTTQSYLLILILFNSLAEQIENAILKEASSKTKVYLAPLAESNLISIDFVESIAYRTLLVS